MVWRGVRLGRARDRALNVTPRWVRLALRRIPSSSGGDRG